MRKTRNHLAIVKANLRQIVRDAARLSEAWDEDITPSDAYGILLAAQRAYEALTGQKLAIATPRRSSEEAA